MKYEWKKQEKNIYLPKEKPELIELPCYKFFMLKGQGNPNGEDFAERVGILYSLSYTLKMLPKKGITPEGYYDYTVYPLEGLWDLTEEGRKLEKLDKNELVYTIMIRQPDFVDEKLAKEVIEMVKKKSPNPLLDEVTFGEITDGKAVQMLHVGSYDDEPRTFAKMQEFIANNNLELRTKVHREIYLSDARKTEKEKLKTVLRYMVK
jgi:hypothetical protein